MVSGGDDGRLFVMDLYSNELELEMNRHQGHEGGVLDLHAIGQNAQNLSLSRSRSLSLNLTLTLILIGGRAMLTTGSDGTLKLWDKRTGERCSAVVTSTFLSISLALI